ncbi:hypothetical protein Forpe1208_v006355 [Fusarium oxysporum f. sp. rapae]|uniref:Uncharacterized protein n=1 Tax=Fusarium oxysporum f. sp. rapae TaxID=485398 RepID=A0A8J5PBJ9_FUSOX|nr:hypothetical protein Forpe1208_v006355 [Fusarium oxysporum f. sp. rapae]
MSGYYNPGIPPEDENQNQTGYQDQYQDQNNRMQRNQWNPSLSYPGSIEPGHVYFAPNAGLATWGQQPQQHRMPQEHEMEQIHRRNQRNAMNQTNQTNQRNQRNQMQNMYQIPAHIVNPAPAPAPASWHGYNNPLQGMDLANMSAFELVNRLPLFFGQSNPTWSYTGNNADACAGSVSVQNQQHGGQPIAVYPNGGHSNGGYTTHGHAIPPPPPPSSPPQPSPAAPSTGGRRKRGRAASPNTTAPAPKRTRNLAPNASGAEGDHANSSGIPDPAPNTTSTPSRQPQRSRKRKADIDEEDDEDKDDLPADARPSKKPRGGPVGPKKSKGDDADDTAAGNSRRNRKREDHEKVAPGMICDFCAHDPEGKVAYAANPVCDWKQIPNVGGPEVYNRECSNCANYRSRNKDHTEVAKVGDHMCRVPGPITPLIDFEYKRYGDQDPRTYVKKTCDICIRQGHEETCDVDTILGYYCLFCRRQGSCKVGKSVMPVRRPNKLTRRPWYRHPCDRCLMRHKTFGEMKGDNCCSWITNRGEWEGKSACRQCRKDGAKCLDLGTPMASFSQTTLPSSWEIRSKFEKEEAKVNHDIKVKWHEYAEVTTNTTWRKPCKACQTSGTGADCLVMWTQPNHACERCTQFGIDCWVPEGDAFRPYPIFDLSRVGFGHFTPFKVCKQCAEAGRNCDRQRPCDSCRHHHAKCDPMGNDKPGCIDRAKIAGAGNMGSYSPGHLYYLALGYGPGGVDDIKDGRQVEHWIGPAAPVYGLTDIKDRPRHYRYIADAHRHHRPPGDAIPPVMPPDQLLKDTTAQQLGRLITKLWQSSQLPKSNLEAYQKVWALLRDNQNLKMSLAGVEINLPDPIRSARSFQGGPVLIDIERIQNHMPPSVYGYPNATQSQGAPQLPPNHLPNHPSIQYGYGYNHQQDAPAPQTQPYQHPAAQQSGGYTQQPHRIESYQGPAADGQEHGGLNQQQPDAHTQQPQPQPMLPSLGPAYQQIHGNPDTQVYFQPQEGRQMPQDQVPPNQQDCGNLDQQQLDTRSQQMEPPEDPADHGEDRQFTENQHWGERMEPLRAVGQENEDVEDGERRPFADGSAIPAPDIENDQQGPHSGPQAPDQPLEGINESQDDSDGDLWNIIDFSGGETHRRSRSNQEERWHNIKTFKGSKGPLQERLASGGRIPKSANIRKAFNPFLGFTFGPDQKPRFNEKPKSSRWKVFNHLEGIDMDEWHESKSKETEEESQPRLFSIVNGQTNQPAPLRDVLGDVPHEERGGRTSCYCAEPGEGGRGVCGSWNTDEQDQATCQSSAHRNTAPGYFPVCNDCTRGNVKYLFQHEHNPITEGELLGMRAYLCNDCAGRMSSGAPNAAQNQTVGARRVYGIAADGEYSQNMQKPVNDTSQAAKFISNTEALTGCSCANRMLGTSLCRFHRLYYAEEVMKHSALMQEWRLSRFKKAVCPSCLAQKPSKQVNVSANVDGFVTGAPTAWACVVCNDWVVNEQNDGNNQPMAIDKPLWNLNIGRKLLHPRREITQGRVPGEEVSV